MDLTIAIDSIEALAIRADNLERIVDQLPADYQPRFRRWLTDYREGLAKALDAARKREAPTDPELPRFDGENDDDDGLD